MTTLKPWSEGSEVAECGLVIGGIAISWAEIELATDRATAIDIGLTDDLLDRFEEEYSDYKQLINWLESQVN